MTIGRRTRARHRAHTRRAWPSQGEYGDVNRSFYTQKADVTVMCALCRRDSLHDDVEAVPDEKFYFSKHDAATYFDALKALSRFQPSNFATPALSAFPALAPLSPVQVFLQSFAPPIAAPKSRLHESLHGRCLGSPLGT